MSLALPRRSIDTALATTRWRWLLLLVPLLVFASLAAWVFASPTGSAADDDYHLNSIWCGQGLRPGLCEAGSSDLERKVPVGLSQSICEHGKQDVSPNCQKLSAVLASTKRLNTDQGYPKLYYAAMSVFASTHLERSVLTMRLVNVGLFTLLTSVLYWLLPFRRRMTLVLTWIAALVPLGAFLIASVNPSGWVIIGCGTAWLATIGYFEQTGWRRYALAAVTVAAVFVAAGARGDGAVYVALSVIAGTLLAARRDRRYWMSLLIPLPIIAALIAYFFAKDALQLLSIIHGEMHSVQPPAIRSKQPINIGFGLVFQNLINMPNLWIGSFGAGSLGSLGWFDIPMPWAVPGCSLLAYLGIILWGFHDMSIRKGVTLLGILTVITLVPLWFFQKSHFTVGTYLQPRYLYPGLVLLAGVAALSIGRRRLSMSKSQLILLTAAVTVAFGTAIYSTLRRYVDAAPNDVFFDLNSHRVWWWGFSWLPDPMRVLTLGSAAFAAAIALSLFLSVPRETSLTTTAAIEGSSPVHGDCPTSSADVPSTAEPDTEVLPMPASASDSQAETVPLPQQ